MKKHYVTSIQANNVNETFKEAIWKFKVSGEPVNTRNGDAIRIPGTFVTTYLKPEERVLFSPDRNCNPFFHLFEALWMLAGRKDVKFVKKYSPTISNFSDDGETFNAAYGYRWRHHFNADQIQQVINNLKNNADSRQEVIQIWDNTDLVKNTKDKACNTQVKFEIVDEKLNMYVSNRSNDLIWGTYGANVVHFSMLQEYVANSIGIQLGFYQQISNNTHIYKNLYPNINVDELLEHPWDTDATNYYSFYSGFSASPTISVKPKKMFSSNEKDLFDKDLSNLDKITDPTFNFETSFFEDLVKPLALAFDNYKSGKLDESIEDLLLLVEPNNTNDWLLACIEWLIRISKKRATKNNSLV